MKYLFFIIVIVAAIGTFTVLINPHFHTIAQLRSDIATYNERLHTADQLKASREQLIASYNSIQKADLDNLKTLLPDSVDNIRLIIQINALALQNGLSTVENVQYDTTTTSTGQSDAGALDDGSPYGTFLISFSTKGSYKNFLTFLSAMEENLRLVDVIKVDFDPSLTATTTYVDSQEYKVTLKTYWLKQ